LKKFLVATAGLVAIGVAAPVAADDLGRPYTPSPAMPIVYDWSGLYIGGNAGWGQSHSCWNFVPIAGAVIPDGCRDQSSGVIGGQFGYRWQASQFVVGLASSLYATIPWRVSPTLIFYLTTGGFFSGRYRPDKPVTEGRFSKDTWSGIADSL
jgi:opacity protein-like surface antigen